MKIFSTIPALLLVLPLLADDGASVAYEGALRQEIGQSYPAATYGATLSLHATASDNDPLWWRHYDLTLDERGLFRVELSDTPPRPVAERAPTNTLAAVLRRQSSTTLFVGLRLDRDGAEVAQRQRLLSVPCALFADDALGSVGAFAAGAATVGGFVATQAERSSFGDLDIGSYLTFTASDVADGTKLTAAGNVDVGRNADIRVKQNVGGGLKILLKNGEFSVSGDLFATNEPVRVASLALPRRANRNPVIRVNGVNGCVPFGTIILWYGKIADLPADWKVCDGKTYTNSEGRTITTPNLVDRFPVGAGASAVQAGGTASDGGAPYAVGDHGGEATHVLVPEEIPAHVHKSQTKWYGRAANESCSFDEHTTLKEGSNVSDFKHPVSSWNTRATGGGKEHENRPLHKRLVYVMKVE